MTIGEFIKARRKELGLTAEELAERIGKNRATIYRYESNYIEKLPANVLQPLAQALQMTAGELVNKEEPTPSIPEISNIVPIAKKKIPLIGTIAAGQPITADEHIEMLLPSIERVHADFALRVEGDSMIGAGIYDGDIVFIRQQPDVENGQIAAVLIDDSATLKHVYKTPNSCTLVSENPKFPPMVFNESNCDTLRILGLAVAKYSRIKQ